MKELLLILGGALLLTTAILAGTVVCASSWDKHVCKERAALMKLDPKYSMSTGCMVSVGDMYVPINAIRIINGHLVVEQGDGN